jgi:hypothetical protein
VTDKPQLPITLRPNRSGTGFFIVLSLIFIVISWYSVYVGAAVGYFGIAFFGLGLIVFVIKLLPNSAIFIYRKTVSPFAVCFAVTRCRGLTRVSSALRIWA